jgi:ribosomal protein S27E
MTSWLKLLDQQCRSCGSNNFFLTFTKLSTMVVCERCGSLFTERPLGAHRIIDQVEPTQLDLPISA